MMKGWKKLINTLREDGTWPGINYEDVSRTGFEHRFHLSNMVELARAYKSDNSIYRKSKEVKNTLERALQNWVDHDYFCDNWWYNQIGTPSNLVTILLITGDELPAKLTDGLQPMLARATLDAGGARPGGDRIKIASIQAKNMLFLGDKETFNEVVRVIESEIKYVEWIGARYGYGIRRDVGGFQNRSAGGRGIQNDNSFHHRVDGVNNTLSYGLGYANAFIEWAVYTAGTQYAFSDGQLEKLIDYFLDGICKTAIYGKYPDPGAKNRSISRKGTLAAYNAEPAEKLLLTSDYRRDEIQEIVNIRNKGIKPTTSHATFFWDSEHFSFQRPDFFTSVRMYSTRNYNMEQPYNSEGLFNHHRGDGTNHISITGDEYFDIAPVFDYQKIPGATIMQKPELPSEREIQKLGLTDFVGAATDGKYAAVGFDFKSPHDPLCARKSWFFFDKEYVCLGAGISGRRDLPVVTTINQCLLRDDVTIHSGDQKSLVVRGEHKINDVDWVFQDGIGYVFPEPLSVNIKNNEATGSWWDINKQTDSPKEEVRLDVFKLWLDHGDQPIEASYAYIVVPATTIDHLTQATSKNNIAILENTPYIQAVMHNALNMIQLVFYKAGEVEIAEGLVLRSENPGIIILKMEGRDVKQISVSDPNRELGTYRLSISSKLEKNGEKIEASWSEQKGMSEIDIMLPQGNYAGKSVSIDF
jgi:chondroitin AC lyase